MTKLNTKEKWTFSLTLLVAIVGATLVGGLYGNRLFGAPMQSDLQKRLHEYTDLLSAVTANSAEDIGSDKFVYSSIDGMLRTLDPHTSSSSRRSTPTCRIARRARSTASASW
jgi:hypothetical protein